MSNPDALHYFLGNRLAVCGLALLCLLYLLAGFTFLNDALGHAVVPDPDELRITEKSVLFRETGRRAACALDGSALLAEFPVLSDALAVPGKAFPLPFAGFRLLRQRLAAIGLENLESVNSFVQRFEVVHENKVFELVLFSSENQPPSPTHLFGSDEFGRDVFARVLYASRISLSVGFLAVVIALSLGVLLGCLAGYYGGFLDSVIMRLADVWMSLPGMMLLLTFVALTGANLASTILLIGVLSWPSPARLVRAEVLSLRQREFVEAAKAIGCTQTQIIFRHILPNALAPIIVQATLFLAGAILLESGLSFLGLGVQPPTASWGNMLSNGLSYLRTSPWQAFFPGFMLFLTVLSFNFVAEGLREALDPKRRRGP